MLQWEEENEGGTVPATPDPNGDVLHINLTNMAWQPPNCDGKDSDKLCLPMTVEVHKTIAKTAANWKRIY